MDHFTTTSTINSVNEIQDVFNWSIRTTHGIFKAQSYRAQDRTFLWARVEAEEELTAPAYEA
ncbi:hypothetical protein [Mesorhizobium loti]|uniref:hypothetical protein n=1 Tax=Rhizobium loti TaxID=381 RepID=UPI0004153423|nr:hypothetical protein [Mesorhizobium loti]